MEPTIGRIVHYTLSEIDASLITGRRSHAANMGAPVPSNVAQAGDTYPALIVRVFGGPAASLQVMLDGADTYWACSRMPGDQPGTWAWPSFAGGGIVHAGRAANG